MPPSRDGRVRLHDVTPGFPHPQCGFRVVMHSVLVRLPVAEPRLGWGVHDDMKFSMRKRMVGRLRLCFDL